MSNNAVPAFTIKGLMEDGVHYGHRVSKWNPLMAEYIYCAHHGIHIIDLGKTASLLRAALGAIHEVARKNGRVLFLCTKPEAREAVEREAKRCGQYYVNTRWLGGTFTNWQTVSKSIRNMDAMERDLNDPGLVLLKKERMKKQKKLEKMHVVFNGIKNMGNKADLLCVIGVSKDAIAIQEARKIGVPVVGILDTDCNPLGVDYPIPGNDDSMKAIDTYLELWASAVLGGLAEAASSPPSANKGDGERRDRRHRRGSGSGSDTKPEDSQ